MTEHEQLTAAIAAIEAQRALLGDTVADTALGPLRDRLAGLAAGSPAAAPPRASSASTASPAAAAAPTAPASTRPEQTLKQVCVLFLDVVGSTALSEHLDPEDIHAVIDGTLQRCTAVVQAHGGKVLQYAGDNLLAAFGAEQTQDDDAERAVRCGLALLDEGRALRQRVRDEHGHDGCDVRVGIHTGPVLLGGGVDDEGSIRGLTVNVAARMEQTAPTGGLRISQHTWSLVRGVFDVEAQPPLTVHGHTEPLVTYLVQRAQPRAFRLPARGIEGLVAPLVGRDAELARLAALVDRVVADRRLHALTLVGHPGLGKSRLLHELQGLLETHAQRFWLLLGRAHPQSRLQPYGLVRDLLAWRLQIADSDSGEQARAKLVDGLVPWLGERAEAKAHVIGQLIGLDFSESPHVRGLEPRLLRTLAFGALHDYLRGLTAGGSAVAMLLEDLQWADDGSLDFIAEVLRDPTDRALLLVATARPQLLERYPDWGGGSPAHQALTLQALDAAQGDALARALLQRIDGDAQALLALLIAQADGNPFYMEELVRMFLDDGVIVADGERWQLMPDKLRNAHVPTTLVGVLQARLDALPAADRHALQQASIVGYVFWDEALGALDAHAVGAVGALQDRSLIQRRDGSAFDGTVEEVFHHHLLQQVTYDTVLKPARRAGHAAAAQWLAERIGDRNAEYLQTTAEHYDRAGDHAKALDYFERAAHDAANRFANQAALDYVERALQSPALTDPRRRSALLFVRQSVADLIGQRPMQEATLAAREQIAEALDDDAMRADVVFAQALLASRRSDEALAFQLASRAAELGARSGNAHAAALGLAQRAWSQHSLGDSKGALSDGRTALATVRAAMRRDDNPRLQLIEVQIVTLLASVERSAGDFRTSHALSLEALALAQQRGLRRPMASTLTTLGDEAMDLGRFAQACVHFDAALAIADEMGWTTVQTTAHYNLSRCKHLLGDSATAGEHLQQAEAAAVRSESADIQARCLMRRGEVAAEAGDEAAATAAFERAIAVFETLDLAGWVCLVRARIASLHLAHGRIAQAAELVERIAIDLDAGAPMASTEEPLVPRVVCHRVWVASGDARASSALEAAHAALLAQVAAVGDDDEMRRGVLENFALHREIERAWSARLAPPAPR